MNTKFDSLYAGHVDMLNVGLWRGAGERPPLLERALCDGVGEGRGDGQAGGPARVVTCSS